MAIQRRSLEQHEFNTVLMRTCPRKIQLIHAFPYNCVGGTCFINGRNSLDPFCPICDGTGYLTGNQTTGQSQNPAFSQSPYAKSYHIYGDIQQGHGLYGAGGNLVKLIADLGKENIGDATIFTKMWDIDHSTGAIIYPVIDQSLPRPDRIISIYGDDYNIVREVIVEIGNNQICRVFSANKGEFSPSGVR